MFLVHEFAITWNDGMIHAKWNTMSHANVRAFPSFSIASRPPGRDLCMFFLSGFPCSILSLGTLQRDDRTLNMRKMKRRIKAARGFHVKFNA